MSLDEPSERSNTCETPSPGETPGRRTTGEEGENRHAGDAILQWHAPGAGSNLCPEHSWRRYPHTWTTQLARGALRADLHGRTADGGNWASWDAVGWPGTSNDPDPGRRGLEGWQLFL